VIEAPSLLPWIAATGLPAAPDGDSPLRWRGKLDVTDAGLSFEQDGEAIPATFKAGFSLDGQRALSAEIETSALTIGSVMSWAFMPWRGSDVDLQDSFSTDTWLVKSAQFFLKPKVFETGLGRPVRESVIGLSVSPPRPCPLMSARRAFRARDRAGLHRQIRPGRDQGPGPLRRQDLQGEG
jgi:hypothetical protein